MVASSRADRSMIVEPELDMAKIRCSPFHGALEADPIGSAGAYDGFLCVEVAAPWEKDISLNEPFLSLLQGAKVATGADGRVWRPQGIKPGVGAPGVVRVLVFDRPPGAGGGPFARREWVVPNELVLGLCVAIVGIGTGDLDAFGMYEVQVPQNVIDVLVCTHGKRDVCCGGLGTSLHSALGPRLGERTDVRLWRTSHTGGHRFAATALTFPDGYAWAHLDEELVEGLIDRSGPTRPWGQNCRGLSSLQGAPAQIADRAALVAVGWKWADAERTVVVTAFDRESMATTVRVTGEFPDGTRVTFEVQAEILRHVAQPTCGVIDEPEFRVEPVWAATSVEALSEPYLREIDA